MSQKMKRRAFITLLGSAAVHLDFLMSSDIDSSTESIYFSRIFYSSAISFAAADMQGYWFCERTVTI